MDILVIGASGMIGPRGDGGPDRTRPHGPGRVPVDGTDIAGPGTVPPLDVDAVVCCAASGGLTRIDDGTDDEFPRGLHDSNFWGAIPQTPGTCSARCC